MLLAVPEVVLESVKRLSGLDIEDSPRLTPEILLDEDVGPNSGEATVGEESIGLSVTYSAMMLKFKFM